MAYVLDDENKLPEMKLCPFCGKEPALQVEKRYPRTGGVFPIDGYSVVCNTFGCPIYHADNTYFTKAETAIKAWNTRKNGKRLKSKDQVFQFGDNPTV